MSSDFDNLQSYLTHHGWRQTSSGTGGATWESEAASMGDSILRIPWHVDRTFVEWTWLMGALADSSLRHDIDAPWTADELSSRVIHWFTDVEEFRGVGDIDDQSISLDRGAALIDSAKSILRTSATTSRGIKADLSSRYSLVGDRIADQARMGHTKPGSFVIPILMPVEPNGGPQDVTPLSDEMGRYDEPDERRATRTMAQALEAIEKHIVEPAREPTGDDIAALVSAGVAVETLKAVRRVFATTMSLNVNFQWAGGLEGEAQLPTAAELPVESDDLLARAVTKLARREKPATEILTGYIVQLRDEHDETTGTIRLSTVRSGRYCEVSVDLDERDLERAHGWFRDRVSLRVEGRVATVPGKPSRIERLEAIGPISEGQFQFGGTAS